MEYAIVGTAPSMDGYASSGAAMIIGGMKITYTTHPPKYIVADVDVVKNAPIDMLRAGYGDIVGKYSSLNDWKLSHLINNEHFCQEIYDLVLNVTDDIRDSAEDIVARKDEAIESLTKALVLIGVTLSLLGSTRPGSGSEHHLSHYFEITGILRDRPYFLHGVDVAYSTYVTAKIRERLLALDAPEAKAFDRADWEANIRRVYGKAADGIIELQEKLGWIYEDKLPVYREKWAEIRAILADSPSPDAVLAMLASVGLPMDEFERMYSEKKRADAVRYAKDLKDRYTVLWMNEQVK